MQVVFCDLRPDLEGLIEFALMFGTEHFYKKRLNTYTNDNTARQGGLRQ
jgi:hypothetical protein